MNKDTKESLLERFGITNETIVRVLNGLCVVKYHHFSGDTHIAEVNCTVKNIYDKDLCFDHEVSISESNGNYIFTFTLGYNPPNETFSLIEQTSDYSEDISDYMLVSNRTNSSEYLMLFLKAYNSVGDLDDDTFSLCDGYINSKEALKMIRDYTRIEFERVTKENF